MNSLTSRTFLAAAALAVGIHCTLGCSDDGGASTEATVTPTTSPTTITTPGTSEPTSATSGIDPTTTGLDTSTSAPSTVTESSASTDGTGSGSIGTTSPSTTDDLTGTSSDPTAGWPGGCLDETYDCAAAPPSRDFCTYVAESCAEHQLEAAYCQILADKCAAVDGSPGQQTCDVCLYLELACDQVGVGCDDLAAECACVADGLANAGGETGTTGDDEQVWCGLDGGLLGPCVDNNCTPPFTCNNSKDGAMCVPSETWVNDHAKETEACIEQVGGVLDCETLQSWCQVGCSESDPCVTPATCDKNVQICVYPYFDATLPGHTLGPCINPDLLCLVPEDECLVPQNTSGSICMPPGGVGLVNCVIDDECPSPMICSDLLVCVWAICSNGEECPGGSSCDPSGYCL